MALSIQRLNARKSQPNANIIFIKPLPGKDEKIAQSFLERIAAQCYPVMKKNHLSVTTLEEFPPNREFVGRNFNAGEVIQLVLKSPSSGRWLPFRYVQMVMMHELAHCQQMNHSRAFWAVRNRFAGEMQELWGKGYMGEGIWGRGAELGSGEWERNAEVAGENFPEHLCGGTYRSRRKRKAPKRSYQEQKQRRIEKKFGKNGMALGADEDTKIKLEKGKKVTAKPRVAGSARGRDLRAAAALARFEQNKTADAVKEEAKLESEEEDGSDDDDEGGEVAVDANGIRLLDGQGRDMIKICEDEDVNDAAVKQELDELLDVFQDRAKPANAASSLDSTQPQRQRQRQGAMKHEPIDESHDTILNQLRAAPTSVKVEAPTHSQIENRKAQNVASETTCDICSFRNTAHSPTCAVCSHVLDATSAIGSWKCKSRSCKDSLFVNSADSRICGACGERKGGL